mmetsp:Transcript_45916/g.67365  ORF Transcript_45916/g.67365 Transcript_45916/m.67365 type:complete len:122 (+) Transcript_45916:734-1099(+)
MMISWKFLIEWCGGRGRTHTATPRDTLGHTHGATHCNSAATQCDTHSARQRSKVQHQTHVFIHSHSLHALSQFIYPPTHTNKLTHTHAFNKIACVTTFRQKNNGFLSRAVAFPQRLEQKKC